MSKPEAQHKQVVACPVNRAQAQYLLPAIKQAYRQAYNNECLNLSAGESYWNSLPNDIKLSADIIGHHLNIIDHVASATGNEVCGGIAGYVNQSEFNFIVNKYKKGV